MFGYIDPASGATIMQLVVAGTVGIGAVVKLKWHTIRGFLDRSNSDATDVGAAEISVDTPADQPAES